jgi:23S rRNA pseudouridine1911/1915/1917 synthase
MKIQVEEKGTLLDLLQNRFKASSKTKLRKMIKHGGVAVDGKAIPIPAHLLVPGQVVEIRRPAPPPPFPVLYEDPFVIAVEKPEGLLSIASEKEPTHTLYRAVYEYVQSRSRRGERIFIVHRLDREVSGVMLFAKTPEVKDALQKGWSKTEKRYCALVEDHPPEKEGSIKSWLKENPIHRVYSCPEGPGAKYAVTRYRLLREYPEHALLEIRLETGRKNQIRAHLSEMGCPIVGDKRYGATGDPIHRLALHAVTLSFTHPVSGKRMTLESPVPSAFSRLGKSPPTPSSPVHPAASHRS